MEIEKIRYKKRVLAIIVRRAREKVDPPRFFTPEDYSLQLGINTYKKNTQVKPHIHVPLPRQINTSLEVLHIDEGEVETYFFNDNGEKVGSRILKTGDTIVLIGGHGLKFFKDTKIIEVKQGPYVGAEREKRFFDCGEI